MLTNTAKLTLDEIRLLQAMSDSRLRVQTAARKIPASTMYMRYNIDKIRAKTGLDPRDFHDLCKLLAMAKEENSDADS